MRASPHPCLASPYAPHCDMPRPWPQPEPKNRNESPAYPASAGRMVATHRTRANASAFFMTLRGSERGRTLAHRPARFPTLPFGRLLASGDPRPAHARPGANPGRCREYGFDDRGPHPYHRARAEDRTEHLRPLLNDGAPEEHGVVDPRVRANRRSRAHDHPSAQVRAAIDDRPVGNEGRRVVFDPHLPLKDVEVGAEIGLRRAEIEPVRIGDQPEHASPRIDERREDPALDRDVPAPDPSGQGSRFEDVGPRVHVARYRWKAAMTVRSRSVRMSPFNAKNGSSPRCSIA